MFALWDPGWDHFRLARSQLCSCWTTTVALCRGGASLNPARRTSARARLRFPRKFARGSELHFVICAFDVSFLANQVPSVHCCVFVTANRGRALHADSCSLSLARRTISLFPMQPVMSPIYFFCVQKLSGSYTLLKNNIDPYVGLSHRL